MRLLKIVAVFVGIFCLCILSARAAHRDYNRALKKFTRSQGHYASIDLAAPFVWTATYLGDVYLQEQVKERARQYRWDDVKAGQVLQEARAKWIDQGPSFALSFYTKNDKWNDLDKTPSLWALSLRQGDRVCAPEKIERISKPSPDDLYFWPYIERWDVFYRIRFPVHCALDADSDFGIELDGLYGQSRLKWISD